MRTIRASVPSKLLLLFGPLLFAAVPMAYSASYIWGHPTSGNWNLAANWSPNGIPAAGDTATISPAGTYTVTVNDTEAVGTLTMSGASGAQTLDISSGTLSIGSTSTGNGNAVVTVSSGTLNGAGTLALAGNLNWTGGTISLGLQIGGGNFSSGDLFLSGGRLTNSGTINWTNGGFLIDGNNSVFTNLSGATIILSNTPDWVDGGGVPSGTHVFGNGGTIVMEGPSSVTTMMSTENFTNSGTITVSSGTLFLSGGTNSDSGPVTVASGATLEMSGADTFSAASSISGAGNLLVSSSGAVALNSGLGLTGSWTFSGGTTTITGTDGVAFNTITVSGGTVNFDGSGTIAPDTFTVSSGTLAGSQNLFAGDLVWTGGTISVGLQIGGGNFSSGDLFLNGGRLTNNGTIYWTNGGFLIDGNDSVFTNVAVATIILSNTPDWVDGGGVPSGTHSFGNGGTIVVEGPSSLTTTMSTENFTNTGTIIVSSGTLFLSGGTDSDSGPVTVASGATLELSGADTFSAAASISGAGNLVVSSDGAVALNSGLGLTGSWIFSGGTTTITGTDNASFFNGTTITVSGGAVNFDGSGTLAPITLTVSSGTLAGSQSMFAGSLDWTGGTISLGLLFGGGNFSRGDLFLSGGMLTNDGTINWTNGGFLIDGDNSVFTNAPGATIILSNTPNWVSGGGVPIGTHIFGNGGTIILNGPGTQTMSTENFVNSGTVTVNSGKLALSGGTQNLANGILNFGISNLASFGTISFSGPSALGGTLTATFNDPSFVPAANDQWQIMTYTSLSGAFSTIDLPPVGDWQTIAGSTAYTIKLTQTGPAPFFTQNLPPTNYGLVGFPAVLSVQLGGTGPFTNQWYSEAGGITNALHDGDRGGRISGATTMTLTITNAQTNDDGPYQIFVTNGFAPYSDVSSVGQLVVELEPLFNGDGALWTLNGGATIQNNALTLTDGQTDEARSAFFNFPMYCQAFHVAFTYQSGQGTTSSRGDGITFCMQNAALGTNAVGTGGGSLAYKGITNSMAIAIDQFTAKGYEFLTNGEDPGSLGHYVQTAPAVDPSSGDPINISIIYQSNAIALSMTDAVTLGKFVTNFSVGPLPVTGGPAYIGFTGATGDVDSVQTISNFSFVPLPPISLARTGANVTLSWPTAIGGYQLQSSTNLDTTNWLTLPGPYNAVGQQYQLTNSPAGNTFYRLALP